MLLGAGRGTHEVWTEGRVSEPDLLIHHVINLRHWQSVGGWSYQVLYRREGDARKRSGGVGSGECSTTMGLYIFDFSNSLAFESLKIL